jgi:hypothetical protein
MTHDPSIPHGDPPENRLLPHHLEQLTQGSGIAPEIIEARSYRSIHGEGSYAELKALGFNRQQARLYPGLLVPVLGIDGQPVLYQFKPDAPRLDKDGKAIKYETPAKAAMRLDMGISQQQLLKDPNLPLWITEGIKKDDALQTHGLCSVGLLGVYNFKGRNPYGGITFLAEWDDIALNGRQVRIVFDNDVMRKSQVHGALKHLTERLQRRGAHIEAVYLPTEGGHKIGVDDYLKDHTVEELEGCIEATRPAPEPAKPKMELLREAPKQITRPLTLLDGHAYAATWLWVRTTITEERDKSGDIVTLPTPKRSEGRMLFVVRDDGQLFGGVDDPTVKPWDDLGLTVHLPEIPEDSRLWSTAGVIQYRRGHRPDAIETFRKMVAVVDHFMDFKRSLASQELMCELTACSIMATYFLGAFSVIGYLWPNGDKGSGKTQYLLMFCEMAYLGQVILAGASYATLRDLADYGATLAFDEAERIMDRKNGDPEKQGLLLAGNRRGSTVPVKEMTGSKIWRTRHINTFCPRLFAAIRLPDEVLMSRTITIPLLRSTDEERANRDPLDHEIWPHDRRELIDELWALGLAHLPTLRKYEKTAIQKAQLNGRNLEPWRAIMAVAAWLDAQDTTGELQQLNIDEENGETAERHGLLHRLERLSMAYQGERSDLEAHDPVRLLILALVEMATGYLRFGVSLMEFETSELVEHINRIAKDQEVVDGDEKVTNARRIGWLLKRLRFQKATPGKTRKRWKTTAAEIISLARAYGMTVSLGENDKNDENGETATA